MKILIKLIVPFVLMFYISNSFALEKQKDCSLIKADTGVKMYEAWKCKKGIKDGEGFSKKLKNLLKKKN